MKRAIAANKSLLINLEQMHILNIQIHILDPIIDIANHVSFAKEKGKGLLDDRLFVLDIYGAQIFVELDNLVL